MPQLYLKEVEPFLITSHKEKQTTEDVNTSSIGEQRVHSRRTSKRNTSLVAIDALLLCLELLQILAVLQAMSLKWFWPESWIKKANFIFFFTADAWEYIKVDCGAFIGVRNYDTPSTTVDTKFYYILTGWASFFTLFVGVCVAIKVVLHVKQPAYLLMYNARLHRAVVIILQIVALPFGVSAFKLFHCASDGQMSVDNSVECWSGLHWAYLVPVLLAAVVIMGVFPVWLFWRIHHEAMASANEHHEDFLKLKEAEYMSGLDMVWAVRALHLFSSFRLRAIYYRPTMHLVKLVILVIYAATFQSSSAQAFGMMGLLVVVALVALAVRPFRLTVFNVVLVFGYFCLTADALFGGVITQFNPTQVESPWLVEPYSIAILIALNAVLLLGCVIIFLLYLFIYRFCCQGHFVLEPLWPVMTTYQYDVEGVETQKYLAAVLRGRAVIERCRRLPAMFTPVHEMAHQIKVLNAYMRESELLLDGLHPTLWAVLDELIDMHHRLEPKSLFGEMVQESIRWNAAHFMTMMPMFAQRLAQRDYDLILTTPLKKRMLLKMYIIALFLDGSRRRKTHQELTQRVLTSIWEESPELVQVTDEREYHEDLYPATIQGPDTEALYATGTLDLGRGLYDLEAVEEEEESLSSFLKRVPPTLALKEEAVSQHSLTGEGPTGEDNPAFTPDDDTSSSHYTQSDQALTTADVHDTSEAPPDVLIDLEATAKKQQETRETTVDLHDYQPGESSTDVPVQGTDDPKHEEHSSEGHKTDISSSSSSSSASSPSSDEADKSASSSDEKGDSDQRPSSAKPASAKRSAASGKEKRGVKSSYEKRAPRKK